MLLHIPLLLKLLAKSGALALPALDEALMWCCNPKTFAAATENTWTGCVQLAREGNASYYRLERGTLRLKHTHSMIKGTSWDNGPDKWADRILQRLPHQTYVLELFKIAQAYIKTNTAITIWVHQHKIILLLSHLIWARTENSNEERTLEHWSLVAKMPCRLFLALEPRRFPYQLSLKQAVDAGQHQSHLSAINFTYWNFQILSISAESLIKVYFYAVTWLMTAWLAPV